MDRRIVVRREQRLSGRFAPTQREEGRPAGGEVELRAEQPMRPPQIDLVAAAEDLRPAGVGRAAHEDGQPVGRTDGWQQRGHRWAIGRRLDAHGVARSMG